MNRIEQIMEPFQQHHGFMTYQEVPDEKLPYKTVLKMIEHGEIETEEKGLYRLPDTYPDEWFVMQNRFKKRIYSLETAL